MDALPISEKQVPAMGDDALSSEEGQGDGPPPCAVFSREEVAKHNGPEDLWIVIKGGVFDMTEFQREHPGGFKILRGVAGKDATQRFQKYHRDGLLEKYQKRLKVGDVDSVQTITDKKRPSRLRLSQLFKSK